LPESKKLIEPPCHSGECCYILIKEGVGIKNRNMLPPHIMFYLIVGIHSGFIVLILKSFQQAVFLIQLFFIFTAGIYGINMDIKDNSDLININTMCLWNCCASSIKL